MFQENALEKKLAEEPIVLPNSPFWDVLKVFGRDELIALIINVASTAGMALVIHNHFLLAIVGPAVEKIGFFVAYFKEAWEIYRTTPREKRGGVHIYVSGAFRRGLSSLGKDVAFHDPMYAVLLYLGLIVYPQTPAWILSTISFLVALGALAVGEVALNEIRYSAQTMRYRRAGFKLQSYYESRFYLKNTEPEKILHDLAEQFHLRKKAIGNYRDRYFGTNLKSYNSRKPMFRLRQRTREDGGLMQTAQIVYTRTSEVTRKKPGQFNFYPTKKEKLWIELEQEMPWMVADIRNKTIKNICAGIVGAEYHEVLFARSVARDPETMLVSVDHVTQKNSIPFVVIEIKSWADEKSKAMLIEAMRYVMLRYEVIQTTHNKNLLTSLDDA